MKKAILAGALVAFAAVPASAQPAPPRTVHGELMLYDQLNYNGDNVTLDSSSPTVHTDWNIRSLAIHPGDSWQICARSRFRDPCIVLNRSVPDSSVVGIDGQIGSARPAPAAAPAAAH